MTVMLTVTRPGRPALTLVSSSLTSTFDGYAIAHAVFAHVAEAICCRTLFATHYHLLTEEYAQHPAVTLRHMSCHADEAARKVTFLYKLAAGVRI